MRRIRFRVIILACWLVVLCNLERLLEPLYFSRFTYVILLVMAVVTLFVPRVARFPLWVFLASPVPLLLVFKWWDGAFAQSISIPLIFMEICCLGLTIFLSYWVNMALSEFESSVDHITIGEHDKLPEPYAMGKGLIYQEVRRARNHQHPLTLMTVAVEEKSIKGAVNRMAQEAQQTMMRQYTLSNVSKTLCMKLEDSDIIVQQNDHFLIVLPETKPEFVPGLINRLRQQVSEQVGVDLKIGTAFLPEDGFTLEGLLDKATMEMRADLDPNYKTEAGRLAVK